MRQFLYRVLLVAIGVFFGYALGYRSPAPPAKPVPVACFDAQGKEIPDWFAKFGGVRVACAPGEVAKLPH